MATPVNAGAAADKEAKPLRKRSVVRRVTLGLVCATALLAAAGAWFAGRTKPFQALELNTYDLRFVWRGALPPPPEITLVLIDERTEKELVEPRIFWHSHYAELLRAAAAGGAKVIGLDVFFAIPVGRWDPDADRQLAATYLEIARSVPIVLGYSTLQPGGDQVPLYMAAALHDAKAFTNLTTDVDGCVRRQAMQSGDGFESFAARIAALTMGVEHSVIDPQQHLIRFGSRSAPLAPDGSLTIHYWGPGGTFRSVSMAEVLETAQKGNTAQLADWFRGKTVLIGNFLPPDDMHATPYYWSAGQRWQQMSGVEIHANTIATLLEQKFIRETPARLDLALVLVAAALAALCVFSARLTWSLLALAASAAAYIVIAVLLQQKGWVLPIVPPLFAGVLSGIGSYGVYSATEGRQRKLLQEKFGRFVSPEVVGQLLDSGSIPLGGELKTITVMFSDLRNFTQHCHGLDPTTVVEELNTYFADMTAEIKRHGGKVDKFIGDGIMALFGAPFQHQDHALRAVRCALDMIRRNEEFNERRARKGLDALRIGLGLHSGEALVGTIGAPDVLMDYTAIGDTVNIASRIEGENKKFESQLLVSGATYELVQDHVLVRNRGETMLKGVAEPVTVYQILGLRESVTP